MPIFKCAIEKISDWHPHLFLEAHIVACVAVMRSHSASPAAFEVTSFPIGLVKKHSLRLKSHGRRRLREKQNAYEQLYKQNRCEF